MIFFYTVYCQHGAEMFNSVAFQEASTGCEPSAQLSVSSGRSESAWWLYKLTV